MAPTRGLLENRPILIGILLFCLYQCVMSWLTIARYGRFPHDPVSIFGLTLAAFIAAAITFRSSLFADRLVFGAITVTLVLTAVRMARLTSSEMLVVKGADALMWTAAAAVSLAVLLRGFNISHKNG
jgi:hypothetical protein